jgi:acyl-CoA synthetase (AMP-forming)/AMP-acid ligase II/acyl carrier protein
LLQRRAEEETDRLALVFLADGETEKASITYGELDRQARGCAALLEDLGYRGERVLLLYPPGLEYVAAFFGCLYAGAIAVPAYPPRRGRSLERLRAIARDAQAVAVLAANSVRTLAERDDERWPELRNLNWLTLDRDQAATASSCWRAPACGRDDVALLQYTSGSTSSPKGVILTHGNLLHNCDWVRRRFGHSAESRGVIWLPPYHDMGLIGGILQPLYTGFPCYLMSPVSVFTNPLAWLQAVSRYRATTSGGPNFAYDLCVRKVTAEQRATLDLSAWQVAFTGAEPVRAETLDRFAQTFASCGFRREAFYPCYGLAEATLIAAGGERNAGPRTLELSRTALEANEAVPAADPQAGRQALVGCGTNLADQRMMIVDPERLAPCSAGRVGEVWLNGPSVARGYWGRPEETEQTFRARLAEGDDGVFLRTGDLGFVHDGELFITGRLKDLIILRGRNLYPHDLERTAERSHPDLQPGAGAAFAVEEDGQESLVIAYEAIPRRQPDPAGVGEAVRRAVADEHDADLHTFVLLKPGGLPKTSSGKIQRSECRRQFLEGSLEAHGHWRAGGRSTCHGLTRQALLAAPPSQRETQLQAHFRNLLARVLEVDASAIDTEQPINTFGLSSLATVELKNAIEEDFGVALPVTRFLQGANLVQLASDVVRALTAPVPGAGAGDVAALVWQLQRLSDDQVKVLLAGDDVSARSALS